MVFMKYDAGMIISSIDSKVCGNCVVLFSVMLGGKSYCCLAPIVTIDFDTFRRNKFLYYRLSKLSSFNEENALQVLKLDELSFYGSDSISFNPEHLSSKTILKVYRQLENLYSRSSELEDAWHFMRYSILVEKERIACNEWNLKQNEQLKRFNKEK